MSARQRQDRVVPLDSHDVLVEEQDLGPRPPDDMRASLNVGRGAHEDEVRAPVEDRGEQLHERGMARDDRDACSDAA